MTDNADDTVTPWVSILTPIYNGVEFLEECAMSVCLQLRYNESTASTITWEWIIGVNGHGPTGGHTFEVAKAIAAKLRPHIDTCTIRVINLPQAKGKVAALNEMVTTATGDWIALLDCDDTWKRDKLLSQKIVVDAFGDRVDIIGTFCHYFGEISSGGPRLPSGWIEPEDMARSNPIINSSALIRKELAHWEDRFFGLDDYDLWLRLSREGKRFFNYSERLVFHRIHRASAFNGTGQQDLVGLRAFYGI